MRAWSPPAGRTSTSRTGRWRGGRTPCGCRTPIASGAATPRVSRRCSSAPMPRPSPCGPGRRPNPGRRISPTSPQRATRSLCDRWASGRPSRSKRWRRPCGRATRSPSTSERNSSATTCWAWKPPPGWWSRSLEPSCCATTVPGSFARTPGTLCAIPLARGCSTLRPSLGAAFVTCTWSSVDGRTAFAFTR